MKFNGTSWVAFGGGVYMGNEAPDEVLAVFDLRQYRGELIVAGTFSYVGAQEYSPNTVAAFHLARWNGSSPPRLTRKKALRMATPGSSSRPLVGSGSRTADPR